MSSDLQKASMWKRISAWILDAILLCVVATMFMWLLSIVTRYDAQNEKLNNHYLHYETEYGIKFEISGEDYEKLSEEERTRYNEAYTALTADAEAMHTYSMVVNLTLLITSLGIFFACLTLEFVVPLFLKNGQTVGKKIFGLGVMRTDQVRIHSVILFIRSVLGKYAIEIMIPVLIAIMIWFNTIGIEGGLVLIGLLLLQGGLMIFTHTNSVIHDVLAGTVVVDLLSQRIFETPEDRLAYQQKIAAELAAKQNY